MYTLVFLSLLLVTTTHSLTNDDDDDHHTKPQVQLQHLLVTVGTPYGPLGTAFLRTDGTGFVPDLFEALCHILKCDYSNILLQMNNSDGGYLKFASQGFSALRQPRINVVITAYSVARIGFVDYATLFVNITQYMIQRPGSTYTVEYLQQHPEVLVGALVNSLNQNLAQKLFCGATNKTCSQVKPYDSDQLLFQALSGGAVGAAVMSYPLPTGLYDFVVVPGTEKLNLQPASFVFPVGDALFDPFNTALGHLIADGTTQRLKLKWGIN